MAEEPKLETYLEIQGVRIYPPYINFKEKYEKKKLSEKIVIQNVGASKAFIRIPPLKYSNCELECIPRGQDVYPGLRIVKILKLTFDKDKPRHYELPIFINDETVMYTIKILPQTALLIVTPHELDFGIISAGTTRTMQDIAIRNVGDKAVMFYVDTNSCSKSVLVAPNRGYLGGNTAESLTVKVISFKAEDINTTFLVRYGTTKSAPVTIKATIICSELQSIHPNATKYFTLVNFEHTYYGLTVQSNLLVRNYSGVGAMFAVQGQIYNKIVQLEEYSKMLYESTYFVCTPKQGEFEPNQSKVLEFSQVSDPVFTCYSCDHKSQYMNNVMWQLLHPITNSSSSGEHTNTIELLALSVVGSSKNESGCTSTLSYSMSTEMGVESLNEANDFYEGQSERDFIRVHLYGTAEEPSVSITPPEVFISKCDFYTCESRKVVIKNQSHKLPIILRCIQVPYVNIEKKKIILEPLESVSVSIKVCPKRLGVIAGLITYEMMYYDYPKSNDNLRVIGSISIRIKIATISLTRYPRPQLNTGLSPDYIKDVGNYCQDIRFNTKLHDCKLIVVRDSGMIDDTCNYLVALPNDTQQSIRPYRNFIPCLTIFTRKARYIQPIDSRYELEQFEALWRKEVQNYYNRYIRNRCTHRQLLAYKEFGDYDLTMEKKWLCEDLPFVKCLPTLPKIMDKRKRFIPLSTQQMANVIVSPAMIHSGPVATDYEFTYKVTVINDNRNDIRIYPSSEDPDVLYFMQTTYIVLGHHTTQINIVYKTSSPGYFTSNILLIVNETMMLTIPIFMEVVPRTLFLSTKAIDLTDAKRHQYLEMTNTLNVDISFLWMIVDNNFSIEPSMGSVKVGSSLLCVVRYLEAMDGPATTTAQLHCCKEHVKKLRITAHFNYKPIQLNMSEINFGQIPLNETIYHNTIVRNMQNFPVTFTLSNELSGIDVYPAKGCIPAASQYVLHIYARFVNCVDFKDELVIKTVKYELRLPIVGIVIYPNIEIFPKVLIIDKIPASTTASVKFTLKNCSEVAAKIKFDMDEYQDFKISNSAQQWEDAAYLTEFILDSDKSRILYLHFIPSGISSSYFYLPIILNDLIGPPIVTDHISTKVDYYLLQMYDNCSMVKKPAELPCAKVRSLSTKPKVIISNTIIEFSTYPAKRNNSCSLSITSCQTEPECILLETDELKHPIYLECPQMAIKPCGFVKTIHPGQIITMKIIFKPDQFEFGRFQVLLPVYLRSDENEQVHKVIIINAVYHEPMITTCLTGNPLDYSLWQDASYIYYGDMCPPVNKTVLAEKKLKFFKHLPNCQIECKAIDLDMTLATIPDTKAVINDDEYLITVVCRSFPSTEHVYSGVLEITCSCGAAFRWTTLGCIEKSILTTYDYCQLNLQEFYDDFELAGSTCSYLHDSSKSTLKFPAQQLYVKFDKSFPLFPSDRDEFLEQCISAIDAWMCKEVFYDSWGYAIEFSIRIPNYNKPTEESIKRQTQLCNIPLVHFLSNLAGPDILNNLQIRYEFEDPIERVGYLIKIYRKCIDFLVDHGGSFTYLQPEFLLPYKDFMIYKREIFEVPSPPYTLTMAVQSSTDFLRLSRQSWLDLILQAHKVLCLNRLACEENLAILKEISAPLNDFYESGSYKEPRLNISDSEAILINWLDYHFETGKSQVWTAGCDIESREISFFRDCLKDSLVFAVVTVAYCPYLIPHVQDMYIFPETYEEAFHNASVLIRCWELINFSFRVTPEQIITSNLVVMVVFTAYLFENLPYMYPREELFFDAGLSQRLTKKFTLVNSNTFPIAYKAILILNNGCFKVQGTLFVVLPKKTRTVTIEYFAKFALQSEAVLVLSGEVAGFKYARNKCIKLIGNPILQYAVTTIKYPLPLYKLLEVEMVIQSPYKASATYNVQITYANVSEPFELANILYHFETDRLGCGRFILTNKDYVFDQNGQCIVHGLISTLNNSNITAWIYFRNSNLGDFAIKLICDVDGPPDREVLSVEVSKQKLPKMDRLILKIPCKNRLFFETMQSLMVKLTKDEERALWERIIDTPMGVNLLARLMEYSQRSLPFHCTPSMYIVRVDGPSDVSMPESIIFDDECSPGFLDVPLLLTNPGTLPRDFCVTLTCGAMKRIRSYYVEFILKL